MQRTSGMCAIYLFFLLGVNHHHQSIIFSIILLVDETIASYIWLLTQFMKCMGYLTRHVVLSNGDKVIRVAIRNFLLKSLHRLRIWTLEWNAMLQSNKASFMVDRTNINVFECHWAELAEK